VFSSYDGYKMALQSVTLLLGWPVRWLCTVLLCYCSKRVEWLCTVLLCYCSRPVEWLCTVLLCYCGWPVEWLCTVLLCYWSRFVGWLQSVTVLLQQTCRMTAGCYCSRSIGYPCFLLLCYCSRLLEWLQGVTVLLQQVCTIVWDLNSLRVVLESLLCFPKREMGRSHCCATASCQYPHSGTAQGFELYSGSHLTERNGMVKILGNGNTMSWN